MDDEALIQELLYRGEGTTLDYKSKQYPFAGADDGQKAELLKDILAFANAWRTEIAYILIGVKDGSGELTGLDVEIDDSRLQQFINGKTNHPVHFSYRSLEYKGINLGLFTIPVQERPVYIRKAYGTVLGNTVYVRRGSSTAIAEPSEIAKMGAATVTQTQQHAPRFNVKIMLSDSVVADKFSMSYSQWALANGRYGNYSQANELGSSPRMTPISTNVHFYRELALYLQEFRGKVPFTLEISNSGDHFADDVKISLVVPAYPEFSFKDERKLLRKPEKYINPTAIYRDPPPTYTGGPTYSIKLTPSEIHLSFNIGKLQAGETRRTPTIFMINPPASLDAFKGRILSDQLRGPLEFSIPSEIDVTSEVLTMEKLREYP